MRYFPSDAYIFGYSIADNLDMFCPSQMLVNVQRISPTSQGFGTNNLIRDIYVGVRIVPLFIAER